MQAHAHLAVVLVLIAATAGLPAQSVEEVLTATGIRTGVAVHVGAHDGAVEAQLSATGKFVAQGLALTDSDAADARKNLAGGTAGIMVLGDPKRLPYADRTLSLVICDAQRLGGRAPPRDELVRVVAPNGALYLRQNGAWSVVRGVSAAGAVEWPTYDGGAGTPYSSADTAITFPFSAQWVDGPMIGATPADVDTWTIATAGGRIFYVTTTDDANIYTWNRKRPLFLVARDAYSGTRLWRIPYPFDVKTDAKSILRVRPWGLVAVMGERAYVWGPKGELLILNAATGEPVKAVPLTAPRRKQASIRVQGGLVLVQTQVGWEAYAPDGALRWSVASRDGENLANATSLVLREEKELRLIDLSSGKQRWASDVPPSEKPGDAGIDLVLGNVVVARLGGKPTAFDAATGKQLWQHPTACSHGIFPGVWQGGIAISGRLYEALTGKDIGAAPPIGYDRCTPPLALPSFTMGGHGNKVSSGSSAQATPYYAFRLSCNVSSVAANGLIYGLASDCLCSSSHLRGFAAHGPIMPEVQAASFGSPRPVVAGPGAPAEVTIDAAREWPMYRQNVNRSAALDAAPVTKPHLLWSSVVAVKPAAGHISEARAAGNLSGLRGLTCAGGVVAVPDADGLRVVALDAGNGRAKWSFTTGAAIDSPPTFVSGRAVFGSRDGWVYCVSMADGQLIWRTRAAPAEAMMPAYGHLESRWPVIGSVTVQGDTVFATAGRSVSTDGGIAVCALDLASGKMRWARSTTGGKGGRQLRNYNDVAIGTARGLLFGGTPLLENPPPPPKPADDRSDFLLPAVEGLVRGSRMTQDSALHGYAWVPHTYGGIRARNFAWIGGSLFGFGRHDWTWTNQSTSDRPAALFMAKPETDKPAPAVLPARGVTEKNYGPATQWSLDTPKGTRGAGFIIVRDVAIAAINVPDKNGAFTGRLVFLDLPSGKQLHEASLNTTIITDGLIATDGRVLVACEDGTVRCFTQAP